MNPLVLRDQWGYSGTNKSGRIRSYASISWETKTIQNVSSKTVLSSKTKFIIFINYFQSSMKVFSTTGISYWTTGSSLKLISGVNCVDKCPLLEYMICLRYCFSFFSVIAASFHVTSCIFKLRCFNCSNSLVRF